MPKEEMDIDVALSTMQTIASEYQFVEPVEDAVKFLEAELLRLYAENRQLKKGDQHGARTVA
ncbi:hypothetical protein [Paenibacillus alkalitolerans]|uniref:hypothetical protein n=1 Tax=Paenibacillus alkalitolerans TaxID=2799335 RepID=UPI0018F660E6|nr:hypothetical protein [Paenibacillus alkalitolerans]